MRALKCSRNSNNWQFEPWTCTSSRNWPLEISFSHLIISVTKWWLAIQCTFNKTQNRYTNGSAWVQNVENECKLRRRVESQCDWNMTKMRVMCVGIRIKSRVISCVDAKAFGSFCVIWEFITLIQTHRYTTIVQLYINVCGETKPDTFYRFSLLFPFDPCERRLAVCCLYIATVCKVCVCVCSFDFDVAIQWVPHARNELFFNEHKNEWKRYG